MFAALRPDDALAFLAAVSVAYLILVLLIFRRTQLLETRLLLLGLVTALLSLWYGQLAIQCASVQVGPGAGAGVFFGGDVAGSLGRIALLLVLGGVAVSLLNRCDNTVASPNREEAIRDYSK